MKPRLSKTFEFNSEYNRAEPRYDDETDTFLPAPAKGTLKSTTEVGMSAKGNLVWFERSYTREAVQSQWKTKIKSVSDILKLEDGKPVDFYRAVTNTLGSRMSYGYSPRLITAAETHLGLTNVVQTVFPAINWLDESALILATQKPSWLKCKTPQEFAIKLCGASNKPVLSLLSDILGSKTILNRYGKPVSDTYGIRFQSCLMLQYLTWYYGSTDKAVSTIRKYRSDDAGMYLVTTITDQKAHTPLWQKRNVREFAGMFGVERYPVALLTRGDLTNDSLRMWVDAGKPPFGKPNNITDLHNHLSMEISRRKHADKPIPVNQKIDGLSIQGYKLHLARTTHEVIWWGNMMNHCIGSYADMAARGDCTLAAAYDSAGDIAFNVMWDKKGNVTQAYGRRNSPCPVKYDDMSFKKILASSEASR